MLSDADIQEAVMLVVGQGGRWKRDEPDHDPMLRGHAGYDEAGSKGLIP